MIGAQAIDDSRVDYFGISLGGVMGSALMDGLRICARNAERRRRGLDHARAAQHQLGALQALLDGSYSDKIDQQIVLEVLQAYIDQVDGMSIAPHVLADPLPMNAPKQVLLQMGVNDDQVPNLGTEGLARTLPLPLLSDTPLSIYGMTPKAGPLSSALSLGSQAIGAADDEHAGERRSDEHRPQRRAHAPRRRATDRSVPPNRRGQLLLLGNLRSRVSFGNVAGPARLR